MSEEPRNRLVGAYLEVLQHARKLADRREGMLPIGELLEKARHTAAEIRQFSHDELEKVQFYLRRDLQDMLAHARESEKELADWLRIDLALVEGRLLDMLETVADPTRVELNELLSAGFHGDDYEAGEISGPGVLRCAGCGETLALQEPVVIPRCPVCGAGTFRRPEPAGHRQSPR